MPFLGDFAVDAPLAFTHVGEFIAKLIAGGVIAVKDINDIFDKFARETPHLVTKAVSGTFVGLKKVDGGAEKVKEQKGSFDLKVLLGGDAKVADMIKTNGLEELFS